MLPQYTAPHTDGIEWVVSNDGPYPAEFRLTGTLLNTDTGAERSLVLLGLALGLVAGALIWMLELTVRAAFDRWGSKSDNALPGKVDSPNDTPDDEPVPTKVDSDAEVQDADSLTTQTRPDTNL